MIDIDAHHGNGTQAIFWDDAEVLTGSVHVDPGAGWFPHFLGFEDERGASDSNRNVVARARHAATSAGSRPSSELAAWARERRRAGARGRRSASTPPAATRRARST